MDLTQKQVIIRHVYASNFQDELHHIREALPYYPFVSMDTEFPGVIFTPNEVKHHSSMFSPSNNYLWMKSNVDALKIIQLGLTLSDSYGNLPHLGTHTIGFVWQFYFQDFDIELDSSNPKSVELLREQGMDFLRSRKEGIPSAVFRMFILNSGLVFGKIPLTWITFHSCYDFGFMVKLLTGRELPHCLKDFKFLVAQLFGPRVYDIKHVIKFCDGLYGGLDKVAKTLNVKRVVGKTHQAGSDSFVISQTFRKVMDIYRHKLNLFQFQGVLFGLEDSS